MLHNLVGVLGAWFVPKRELPRLDYPDLGLWQIFCEYRAQLLRLLQHP